MSFAPATSVEAPALAAASVETPAFEIVGPLDAPAIVALGGISADRHVCRSTPNPDPGWWDRVAGQGSALDTGRYRIVGVDFLDGGRAADGRPVGVVTTRDQAEGIAAALDAAGIAQVHAVVGASYGGMVALAFAERFPERVGRLVVIAAAHRSHRLVTARRIIQRRIIELGLETGRGQEALALARALAITTYRSAAEFELRFSHRELGQIESYLSHQGDKFARRYSPARYLSLSLSSDLHAVDPASIRVPTTLVAAENDAIVPRAHLQELAGALGAPCRLVDLPSLHGHDAFLTDTDALSHILRAALDGDVS